MSSSSLFETALGDLRLSWRTLRRAPGFVLVVILTLSIGIGATTAVFSVIDRLLFRSLPYRNADRLVSWGFTGPIDDNEFMVGNSYVKWRGLLTPFQSVTTFAASFESQGDLGDHNPARVAVIQVQANFLATFGVRPAAGRDFTRDDDRPNAPKVALLSSALWRSRFGGKPDVLNRTVILDDQPTRIVGVLPSNFEMPTLARADMLIPQQLDEAAQMQGATRVLRAFARLKDGVSIGQARQELQPFLESARRYDVPPPLRKEVHLVVRSVRDRQVGNARMASWMLFGAVLTLLLIACGNVANLLLARAAARERELAMRVALGAGRSRLIFQTLTESLLLSLCGAFGGCLLAFVLLRVLRGFTPEGILRLDQAKLDVRVLLFTLIVSLVAAILFGSAPAFAQPRAEALGSRPGTGRSRTLLRHLLAAGQMAMSLVLLSGALLFARSLWNLERQSIGVEPSHVVIASFQLSHNTYQTAEKLTAFYNQLEPGLRQIPGVSKFALSDSVPPGGWIHSRPFSNMSIIGKPPLPSEGGMVVFRYVSPEYFRVLNIPILRGRSFDDRDRSPSENSIVVSAKLARRMFGNDDPRGQRILLNPQGPPLTVVGVAADVKNNGLANAPDPEYYVVRKRSPDWGLGSRAVALFRTPLSAANLAPWIRAQTASLDPRLPVTISTMRERLSQEAERPRFLAILIGLFAAFGLTLAMIGLYGLMAFLVAGQTREIGVRMALGATPGGISRYILKHASSWTTLGAAVGIAGSFALTRFARGFLFDISPHDPLTMLVAASALGLAALVACVWPSYRASTVDPALSLRSE